MNNRTQDLGGLTDILFLLDGIKEIIEDSCGHVDTDKLRPHAEALGKQVYSAINEITGDK